MLHSSLYCNNNSANPPCTVQSAGQPLTIGARSRHPGGVQAAMCDGSVRFITEQIDLYIWRALSTSQGHEVVSGSDF